MQVTDVPSNACVLGIDPDASGAIAVLRAASQEVILTRLLPMFCGSIFSFYVSKN